MTTGSSSTPGSRQKQGPATATRVWLKNSSGQESPITLSGTRVIFGEGALRKIQAFPSFPEAKDHFERITFVEQKAGAVLTRKEEVPRDLEAESQEPFPPNGFDGELEVAQGVWKVTFEGDGKVSASVCGALARRIRQDGPRVVQLSCDFGIPGKNWEKAMRQVRLDTVQAFIFDTDFQTQARQSENSIGDLAAVLDACPQLVRLFATGKLALSPVPHRHLRELHLMGCPLPRGVVSALAESELPSLERLVLSLSAESTASAEQVLPHILPALQAPALREVHLRDLHDVPSFLDTLLDSGLPSHWKTLTLAGEGGEDLDLDDLVPILEKHSACLGTLEALGVSLGEEESQLPALVQDAEDWSNLFLPEAYRTW